jgi:predicted TPR repeat methyltransferase
MIVCHITPTIMDGLVVRWNPSATDTLAEISASRNGVAIEWRMLRTEHDKAEYERIVGLAWEAYRMLAKAAERGPFVRMDKADLLAWLTARGVRVLDVQFGETLADAVKREAGR